MRSIAEFNADFLVMVYKKESSAVFHNLKYNVLFGLCCRCNIDTTLLVTKIYIRDINCEGETEGSFLLGSLLLKQMHQC